MVSVGYVVVGEYDYFVIVFDWVDKVLYFVKNYGCNCVFNYEMLCV